MKEKIEKELARGFLVGEIEKEMLERGFVGNGCGSGVISFLVALILMYIFRIRLSVACRYHDAGYSVSRSKKSAEHKKRVDFYFWKNMELELTEQGVKPKTATWVSRRFYAAVLLKGDKAYWKG